MENVYNYGGYFVYEQTIEEFQIFAWLSLATLQILVRLGHARILGK